MRTNFNDAPSMSKTPDASVDSSQSSKQGSVPKKKGTSTNTKANAKIQDSEDCKSEDEAMMDFLDKPKGRGGPTSTTRSSIAKEHPIFGLPTQAGVDGIFKKSPKSVSGQHGILPDANTADVPSQQDILVATVTANTNILVRKHVGSPEHANKFGELGDRPCSMIPNNLFAGSLEMANISPSEVLMGSQHHTPSTISEASSISHAQHSATTPKAKAPKRKALVSVSDLHQASMKSQQALKVYQDAQKALVALST